MKKILLIVTMAATLSGLTSMGQGNFIFTSPVTYVWNDVSLVGGNITRGGNYNAAFLFQTGGSATPLVASIGALSPTNNLGSAAVTWSPQIWTDLLTDPNYTIAANATAGGVAVGTVSANGGINYNAGSPFGVTGSSANGGTVNVFFIAWDNAFATPALAAAGNSAVGWSRTFAYTYANSSSAPANGLGAAAATLNANDYKFGVIAPVPEPATFALAGLGMAAMLVARRRKL